MQRPNRGKRRTVSHWYLLDLLKYWSPGSCRWMRKIEGRFLCWAFRRLVWICTYPKCGHTYDSVELEQRLFIALKKMNISYHLQDLRCPKCRQVSVQLGTKHMAPPGGATSKRLTSFWPVQFLTGGAAWRCPVVLSPAVPLKSQLMKNAFSAWKSEQKKNTTHLTDFWTTRLAHLQLRRRIQKHHSAGGLLHQASHLRKHQQAGLWAF